MEDNKNDKDYFNVAVLVVGDLNRSPRMLNHCISISECMTNVKEISLIGYNGGDIRSDIAQNQKIKQYYLHQSLIKLIRSFPFIISAFIKIIVQIFSLIWILLFKVPKFKFLIVQNPPGIPSLFISWLICRIRGAQFIIDWHNYGYTILKVNNRSKYIVWLAERYEKYFAKKSNLNFSVSQAEKRDLKKNFGIDAICLPDRPVKGLFKFLGEGEANDLYKKYKNELSDLIDTHLPDKKNDKPIVMISSTSWTPDENFDILIKALKKTEESIFEHTKNSDKYVKGIKNEQIKKVLFLITGRGPLKESFMEKVAEQNLEIFKVKSIWLDSDDYPKLLSLADLGISLHYSSSGIDLPMKVVDMFSGCLPVASVYYKTIEEELVQENKNGYLFKNENDLSKVLQKVILEISSSGKCEKINHFKKNLREELNKNDWVTQWKERVIPAMDKKKI